MASVLVMEDDEIYARLVTILLEEIGHAVTVASTAADGIRMARERPPDLILMDINLPGMDGFHAIGILRQDPRTARIPAVGMTAGRIWGEEETRGRAAGFDAFVEKPTGVDAFRALLARHLAQPEPPPHPIG